MAEAPCLPNWHGGQFVSGAQRCVIVFSRNSVWVMMQCQMESPSGASPSKAGNLMPGRNKHPEVWEQSKGGERPAGLATVTPAHSRQRWEMQPCAKTAERVGDAFLSFPGMSLPAYWPPLSCPPLRNVLLSSAIFGPSHDRGCFCLTSGQLNDLAGVGDVCQEHFSPLEEAK